MGDRILRADIGDKLLLVFLQVLAVGLTGLAVGVQFVGTGGTVAGGLQPLDTAVVGGN